MCETDCRQIQLELLLYGVSGIGPLFDNLCQQIDDGILAAVEHGLPGRDGPPLQL
ncbi:MAG: hypothetical protein GWP08_20320 [Nitrospiraceae bacterium]|nr:hypothetical protein [Nitrospiraceae bacterium]